MADIPILMPKLGLTMTEGLLESWLVAPGDAVKAGDVMFVVETEKIANEIEAQASGVLKSISVSAGETVPIGTVLAILDSVGTEALAANEASEPASSKVAAGTDTAPRRQSGNRVVATPLARRMARQRGVELENVIGTGPRGRIKAVDVETAIAAIATLPVGGEAARKPTAQARRRASSTEQTIAARLTISKQTIPHFYVLAEADVTELLALRAELNADPGPVKISVNHLIVAAVARTLAEQPDINAVWDDGEIVGFDTADIGVAVETPRGLLAPVLQDAGRFSIDRLAGALDQLVGAAREGRLSGDQLKGGAISVSNVGMFGVANLVPIINPGQAAILGVGATRPTFLPDADGAPVLRQVLGLTLSCDHRVLDGARAARFLDAIAKRLEKPLRLLRN